MPQPSLYCPAVPDTHGTAAEPGGECGRVLHYFCSCCLPSRLYCRHRNFTGSAAPCLLTAGAVRGLSPPVRNFTDPGARLRVNYGTPRKIAKSRSWGRHQRYHSMD